MSMQGQKKRNAQQAVAGAKTRDNRIALLFALLSAGSILVVASLGQLLLTSP